MYIQDLFCKYYDYRPFKSIILNKVLGNFSKINLLFASLILPFWFRLFPGRLHNFKKQKGLIVSLTSFPKRIDKVWLVIECILRQSIQPEQIILYLSKDQFTDKNKLPKELQKLEKRGALIIKLMPYDYKSHKKYWYAIKDYPNKNIITIDDDIIYHSKLIYNLKKYNEMYPNSIIAEYTHRIVWNNDNSIKPYSLWDLPQPQIGEKGTHLFFGSGGGTLFPIGSLKDADLPMNLIKDICPLADDIWLNAIVRKNKFDIISSNRLISVPTWIIINNKKLSSINNGNKLNDQQLYNVISFFENYFKINPFKKE